MKLYDPSYGMIFDNVDKLDNEAIAFYGNIGIRAINAAGDPILAGLITRSNTQLSDLTRDNRITQYLGGAP